MSDLNNLVDPEAAQMRELVQQGKYAEALPITEKILRRVPNDPVALRVLSVTAATLGQPETEANLLDELAAAAGEDPLFLAYRAQALGNVARFDESLKLFERAMAVRPGSHEIAVAYGMALLRQGDFARGWEMYDRRESMPEVAQFSKQVNRPRYTGGNLNGKTILLLSEQGLGDTIMFARYASLLAKRGGKVVIVAHPEVADLVRTIPGVVRVMRFGEQGPPFHSYARLLSLPRVFDTTLFDVPKQVPYIRPAWGRVEHWRQQLATDGGIKRVGLVWAGSVRHANDSQRSMHLADFAPLAKTPGVKFYSLQKGARQEEGESPPPEMPLVNLGSQIKDLSDAAALIEVLDLLITVDTAPAHLAGAMGRPVWTILPHSPDWRWMLTRSDSPWYPTMRLFRKTSMNDWSSVIDEVQRALSQWTSATTV